MTAQFDSVIRINRPFETEDQRLQFAMLQERDNYHQIVTFMADYLEIAIPSPHLTEATAWSVVTFASRTASSTNRRVAVLYINTVEVLVAYDYRYSPKFSWHPAWVINIDHRARLPLSLMRMNSKLAQYPAIGEVRRVFCTNSPLKNPVVALAASQLASELLQKEPAAKPGRHNPLLADALFEELEHRLSQR